MNRHNNLLTGSLRILLTVILLVFIKLSSFGAQILVPMDDSQQNHLKAYGIAYEVLTYDVDISWLLNYRGGSFMFDHHDEFENELMVRGVSYEVIADVQAAGILREIADAEVNMEEIRLHKVPQIAVYKPPNTLPWDDAVTLALTYAEIPYDQVYDDEVLSGVLPAYDWLHLHHEDFTGQYGKFWLAFRNADWYQDDVRMAEESARKHGFEEVADLKLSVAKRIRDFVDGGGYMFAMCSAPESIDIALAAEGVDILHQVYNDTPPDPNAQEKLDYSRSFAFENFKIVPDPAIYEKSNIDVPKTGRNEETDFFTLFEFSAKWDPVPTMLTQNHESVVKGFMGQTTAFRKSVIKPTVTILGENRSKDEARYIHGSRGDGTFTFLGGHDPEDYRHHVGDPPTDLDLFPNSPGYRLILNNVLFPAARQQPLKTWLDK